MVQFIPKGSNEKHKRTLIMVQDVEVNSPAYKGGIRSGDFILEINSKPVSTMHAVLDAIGYETGKVVEFKILLQSSGVEKQITIRTESEKE